MSAFYWALYIFIGIIALLCLVSCIMYLTHLCSKEKDYDEEQFIQPGSSSHDNTTAGPSLDITETTQLMSTSFTTGGEQVTTGREQVQLTSVKRRTEMYEQNIQEQTPTKPPVAPRPASVTKPPVPLKPNFDSRISTPRNSAIVKPLNHPPPPPQVEVAVVHPHGAAVQKSSSIKKPKAPPPPPPAQPAENVYENVHKRTAPQPPTSPGNPPSYHDVISKIPVDNYLSDND